MNVHNEMIADLANRRSFIGGSDARTIMGDDESALVHLWRLNLTRPDLGIQKRVVLLGTRYYAMQKAAPKMPYSPTAPRISTAIRPRLLYCDKSRSARPIMHRRQH